MTPALANARKVLTVRSNQGQQRAQGQCHAQGIAARTVKRRGVDVMMRLLPVTIFILLTILVSGACTRERKDPMNKVQHLSIYIARRPPDVYEFASDPRNLPLWAAGLSRSKVRNDGDVWLMDSPLGKVRVKFAERNAFGVMDHDVTLESGVTVHNPMRVLPHGEGSEFMFTLIRQPDATDEQFAADKAAVENDLRTLNTSGCTFSLSMRDATWRR